MKLRHILFVLFLFINGIFVMLPTAKEIRDYKEALLIKESVKTQRPLMKSRFEYNHLSHVEMLKEIEDMMAIHSLRVEKRSLSSEVIQDVNKLTLDLSLAGKRMDLQNLLMEEGFQKKRYRIAYMRIEKIYPKMEKKNLQGEASEERLDRVESDSWLTHIKIDTYFRE